MSASAMTAVDDRVGVASDCGMIRSWAGGRRLGGAETCRRLLRERHEKGGVLVDWRRIVGLEHDGEERGVPPSSVQGSHSAKLQE